MAVEIAKRLGVKLEFVTPNWDLITVGNWKGGWDLSVGGMTPTEERGKVMAFPADATGKRIGALTGSIFEKYMKQEPIGFANNYPTVYKINDPLIVGYDTAEAACISFT